MQFPHILRFTLKWFLYIFPFALFSFFLILTFIFFSLRDASRQEKVLPAPIALASTIAYPVLTMPSPVTLSAKAALVMDADNNVIIFSKNPNLRFSPASTTKIMSVLVGLDYFKQNDVLTVIGPLNSEGSGLDLAKGQRITFENILYAMLLHSANDAAQTLAQNYPGGEDVFVQKMNEKARLWHLHHTHFADPAGLDDDENYTTIVDLAKIASLAMENPLFRHIVRQKSATFTTEDGQVFSVTNRNILLGSYGINGIKTGYTNGAKEVLVTSLTQMNHNYIVIVLNSDDRFGDTVELIKKVIPNIRYKEITF